MSNLESFNRMFCSKTYILQIGWQRSLVQIRNCALVGIFCLVSGLIGLIALPTASFADASSLPVVESVSDAITPLPESADIAAEKVDQFAQAYLKVLELLSDRESELPAAETSAEAAKVQQSIEAEAVSLIEESGLAMPEYMQLLGLASEDATFRDKVLGSMDESLQE